MLLKKKKSFVKEAVGVPNHCNLTPLNHKTFTFNTLDRNGAWVI